MSISSKPSTCHPEKPHMAHGLCSPCYYREHYKKYPDKMKKRNSTPAAIARKKRWSKTVTPQERAFSHRMSRYGITPEIYNDMLHKQGNKCKVCLTTFGARIHVDHDHKTGKVRALLCSKCNTALGMINDNEFKLARLIAYLKWAGSIQTELEPWAYATFVDLPVPTSQSSTS